MNAVTVTAKALRACVGAAALGGVRAEAVLEPLGVDRALLDDPDAHVPLDWVDRAWALAEQLTGDPAIGLHAAELVMQRPAHVIDYLSAYARRPRDMFELIERYQRLLSTGGTLQLEVTGALATFSYRATGDRPRPPQMADFVLAQWVLRMRSRSPAGFPLRRVSFRHPAPVDASPHARMFRAPVVFDAPQDGIEFDAALLDVELADADPTIVALLARSADEALAHGARGSAADSTTDRVRRHLVHTAMAETPSIVRTAKALALSERSLQRKLHAEGTSFRQVLDEVQRDLSLVYLRDHRHSVSEVGFLLGFAHPSAFTRAFRRWMRTSPAAWRARLASPAKRVACSEK